MKALRTTARRLGVKLLAFGGAEFLLKGSHPHFPTLVPENDRRLPDQLDARATHECYPPWKSAIPLPNARMMLHIGAETVENFFVVADAWASVLADHIRQPGTKMLDIGCGCGRTARLLARNHLIERYIGIDVVRPFVDWCNQFISPATAGRFTFLHVDVRTPRYNPHGSLTPVEVEFPQVRGGYHLVFAASLFTHLVPDHARAYLAAIARRLAPDGKVIVSIHDHPVTGESFSGDEFRAEYETESFVDMARGAGLRLLEDLGDLCGQRTLLLGRMQEAP